MKTRVVHFLILVPPSEKFANRYALAHHLQMRQICCSAECFLTVCVHHAFRSSGSARLAVSP